VEMLSVGWGYCAGPGRLITWFELAEGSA
jgi:hypothetical protein